MAPTYGVQVFARFLERYLPSTQLKLLQSISGPVTWLDTVKSIRNHYTPLNTALNAVGTTTLGRAHQDERLVRNGMRLYGQALSQLRQSCMAASMNHHQLGTLLTSMMILVYEVT